MARKSLEQLEAQANAALPDNNSGLISPADVRTMIADLLETIAPAYGGARIYSHLQIVTATPSVLVFQNSIASFPPEWVVDANAGTLTRALNAPALNSRFTINGEVARPAHVHPLPGQGPKTTPELTVELYANDEATGWSSGVTAPGAGDLATFQFTAIEPIVADTIYTLKVSSPTEANYEFKNVLFVGENIPIRSFNTALPDLKIR